jgi:hypothetical protein
VLQQFNLANNLRRAILSDIKKGAEQCAEIGARGMLHLCTEVELTVVFHAI